MRGVPKTKERDEELGEYVRLLRRKIQENGSFLVNYNPLHASSPQFSFIPNFWRFVFA